MEKKKVFTGQISKQFTIDEVSLIIEALSIFGDANRRMSAGLFDRNGRMYSNKRRESLGMEELGELVGSGEVEIRSVPMGPVFTAQEHEMLEELRDVFVSGLGEIEEKIEQNITETVENNIHGVIDELYTMLKGEVK